MKEKNWIQKQVLNDLRARAAQILQLDEENVSTEAEIPDLGFDSRLLTEYVQGLSEQYDIEIHPGIFFEYTTLTAFSDYLLEEHTQMIQEKFKSVDTNSGENLQNKNSQVINVKAYQDDGRQPVIVGAGITGMCISRALSQHKIPHVMLGNLMLDVTPKLGESMNESASIDFLQDYSEFGKTYFIKNDLTFYSAKFIGLTNFLGQKGHAFYDAYDRLGFNPETPYVSLIHVDRIAFDQQLYEQVKASPYCTVIPDVQVTSLVYDEENDAIEKLYLDNGQELQTSFVYDATNHVRLLAKLLKVEADVFDKPRSVFFSHYYSHDKKDACPFSSEEGSDKWMHSTNIIRTYRDTDGIDGVSWCIPEGKYISVGISVDAEEAKQYDKETAMKLLDAAYQRRGIDYISHFPDCRQIIQIPKTLHFIHKRVHGQNWLMAGGTASQIWYPSGSNISLSLFAAKIAPKVLLGAPEQWLQIYQQINQNLIKLHQNWSSWIKGECQTVADTGAFAKEIYNIGNKRMALYALVRNGEKYADVAKEMSMTDIPKYALMSQEIRVVTETELTQQTKAIDKAKDAMYDYIDRAVTKANKKQSPGAMKDKLTEEVVNDVKQLLVLDEGQEILDLEVPELGFSSIVLTQFADTLSKKFDITIHPGVFFEYTTLRAFIDYLLEEHGQTLKNHYGSATGAVPLLANVKTTSMNKEVPVIIGAGITGMCISRALSKQKIHHVMIGNLMVDDTPKLGESMNESASIDFLQDYSEFSNHYYVKNELNFYSRNTAALLNFKGQQGHAFYDAYKRLGFNVGTSYAHLIHLERLGFDRQLYEQVSQSHYCQLIENIQVRSLDYSEDDDVINKVYLGDGQSFIPSFVFDATNHVRLLGKLLNVDADILDEPRTIFFTHYCAKDPQDADRAAAKKWMHSTNIVRAHQDIDGIDGVCWCIPEGNYVSVGISVDAEQAKKYDKETALDLINKAYARRGIDYLQYFSKSRQLMEIPNTRHFMHKRVCGNNWLMAGGAASQIWFPSASNISLSLFAAKIAPKVLHSEPQEWLEVYKQINLNLTKLHQSYNTWVYGDGRSLAELGVFARSIYSFGNKRMALYALVRNGEEYADIARKMSTADISQYAMMNHEIRVLSEGDLAKQTRAIDKVRESLWKSLEKKTVEEMSSGSIQEAVPEPLLEVR